ncbi:hypothetical protein HYC85_026993 [Camellia sinensis]|uniref:Non-haem dioxygenase N-terminal domain-containing protein n=1 Tax=Camellia sinensis TaxID=4442 RepID=A0A7J7G932_CAMSI|nr:hypothetical protein HYC85_026993 [Camellia sinensis]
MGSLTQHKLPIIDFTKENLKPGTSSWDKTIYDHEVSLELHDKVFNKVEELFELPTATKMQHKASIPLYGYVGQTPTVSLSVKAWALMVQIHLKEFKNSLISCGPMEMMILAYAKVFDVSSTCK